MPRQLVDTPRWSPWRRGLVHISLIFSGAMIAAGAANQGTEAISIELIKSGTSLFLSTVGVVMLGAGAERIGAWMPQREDAPATQASQEDRDLS